MCSMYEYEVPTCTRVCLNLWLHHHVYPSIVEQHQSNSRATAGLQEPKLSLQMLCSSTAVGQY